MIRRTNGIKLQIGHSTNPPSGMLPTTTLWVMLCVRKNNKQRESPLNLDKPSVFQYESHALIHN